jgi:hypothetical protein
MSEEDPTLDTRLIEVIDSLKRARAAAKAAVDVTDRERAVILDALAAYSDRLREKGGWGIVPVARPAHFDQLEPMTTAEVEQLYEQLAQTWQLERRSV